MINYTNEIKETLGFARRVVFVGRWLEGAFG